MAESPINTANARVWNVLDGDKSLRFVVFEEGTLREDESVVGTAISCTYPIAFSP